jgi:heparosan-N-sulfate-glucuronate 5-epimerase
VNVLDQSAAHHAVANMSAIPYPIDFEYKIDNPHGPMDASGLPLVRHEGRDPYSNPVTISQFALGHPQRWLRTGDTGSRDKLMQCADWLVANQTQQQVRSVTADPSTSGSPGGSTGQVTSPVTSQVTIGVWFYPYDSPFWGAKAPWVSAMAQGEALSVLSRAWAITPKIEYREAAQRSVESFFVDVNDGGVRSFYANGEPCYEEVAVEPAAHILNGHLFALMGLWDHIRTWTDERALEALALAVPVLTKRLDRYDGRYWSRYSMFNRNQLADRFYHGIHIAQLNYGGTEWNQPSWNVMAQRWEAYRQSSVKKSIYTVVYNAHRGQRLGRRITQSIVGMARGSSRHKAAS